MCQIILMPVVKAHWKNQRHSIRWSWHIFVVFPIFFWLFPLALRFVLHIVIDYLTYTQWMTFFQFFLLFRMTLTHLEASTIRRIRPNSSGKIHRCSDIFFLDLFFFLVFFSVFFSFLFVLYFEIVSHLYATTLLLLISRCRLLIPLFSRVIVRWRW